ncbi:terminase large subunit domain-containing protein [Micromonospora chokoriensis]
MKPETDVLTGAQEPNRWHCPTYTETSGDEAIEFVEDKLGFSLHPWQRFILRNMFGESFDTRLRIWKWVASVVGVVIPRQNGKSFLIDIIILIGLFVFGERIVLTAQNRDTATRSFNRIVELLKRPDLAALRSEIKKISLRSGDEYIEMNNGGIFYVKTRGPDSARGLDAIDRLIMDEAYDVTEDDLAAVLPTVLAAPNPQVCYFSTPPRRGVAGAPFSRLRERGEAKEDDVAWFAWGLERKSIDEKIDTSDRKLWALTNPSMNLPRGMPEANLAILHGDLSQADFECECLGIWPLKSNASLLTVAAWEAIKDEDSITPDPVALAVDISPDRSMACIVAYSVEYRDDKPFMGRTEVVAYEDSTDWIVPRLVDLKERINPVTIVVDPMGPAGSLILPLNKAGITESEDREKPRYGDLLVVRNGFEVSAACAQLVDAVRQKTFRHPGDPILTMAVANAIPRNMPGGGFAWDRRKPQVDISPLVATTNALWGYESRAHLVKRKSSPGAFLI